MVKSLSGISEANKLKSIGKAINSVKGVNQVFSGVGTGFTSATYDVSIKTNDVMYYDLSLGFSINVPLIDGVYNDLSTDYLGL
jgi:hypothetical protein